MKLSNPGKARLVIFDLDGTLLKCNCSLAFCSYLHKKKILSLSQIVFCSGCYFMHKANLLSLERLHKVIFRTLFRGKSFECLRIQAEIFLEQLVEKALYAPVFERLKEALRQGDHVALLSNSPHFLVTHLAKMLKIPYARGSEYTVDKEGRLTDITTIVDGKAKADYLKKEILRLPIPSIAYSDRIIDLPLLEAADKAVAVRPDRRLRILALKRGWEVIS